MLLKILPRYRILTIEDTHELPIEKLQSLGWKVQGISSHSSVLKAGAEMALKQLSGLLCGLEVPHLC